MISGSNTEEIYGASTQIGGNVGGDSQMSGLGSSIKQNSSKIGGYTLNEPSVDSFNGAKES